MSRNFLRRLTKRFFLLGVIFVLIACTTAPTTPTPTQLPSTPTPQGRTLLVTSPADSGPGTLRQAMEEAQNGDTITFDPVVFPPDAPATIFIASELPHIRQGNLTIDASNGGVILDGSNITDPQHGLSISSDHNIVRGLQITGFSPAGVGLYGGAQYNIIGGDRNVGDGPMGQGNLISGNGEFGIGLWGEDTSHNTIQGNYIGINIDGTATWGHSRDGIHSNGATQNLFIDNVIGGNGSAGIYLCCVANGNNTITDNLIGVGTSGASLGNGLAGIIIDRSRYNVVGPGNVIAHNLGDGVLFWEEAPNNTVTQNIIHDNGGRGIAITSPGQSALQPPLIINFDFKAGTVSGVASANCMVEVFSDTSDEGGIYEGQTQAGEDGRFNFAKGAPLTGPILTATATDMDGNTSEFSRPISGTARSVILQQGNDLPRSILQLKESRELADNRIGMNRGNIVYPDTGFNLVALNASGIKRVDMSLYEGEPPIDWSTGSELAIPAGMDNFVDGLAEIGVAMDLGLYFWDKAGHAAGEELSTPRFRDDKQVQDYVEFVRFVVRHFKGRIPYYMIWSEPDYCGDGGIKCILPEDYIELVRQVIPVIREEDPEAKIVSAAYVLFFDRDGLFTLLRSDVVKQFDVISWHAIYDVTPSNEFYGNFYYEYPAIIREIKQTASANGFTGEYWGTDLHWNSKKDCIQYWPGCAAYLATDQRAPGMAETDLQVAKYYARGIVMQLGMDVAVGQDHFMTDRPWSDPTIRNLNTVLAGNKPLEIPVEIESDATNLMSFGFSLPNGDRLFALWTDGVAVDDDPGVPATLTFPGTSAQKVIGIDVLHGFEQELIFEIVNGNLVIRNFLIKDYPIILRLSD